jgi:hypothetical protein
VKAAKKQIDLHFYKRLQLVYLDLSSAEEQACPVI